MAGEGAAGQHGPVPANQILSSVFSFYGNELGDTLDFSSDLFTGGAEMNDVRLEYLQEICKQLCPVYPLQQKE